MQSDQVIDVDLVSSCPLEIPPTSPEMNQSPNQNLSNQLRSLFLMGFLPLNSSLVVVAEAQTPDLSGTWITHQTELQLYEVEATETGPATTVFDRFASNSDSLEIKSGNSSTIGDERFQFVFDNGFLVPVTSGGPSALGLSEEIDTVIRSEVEDVPLDISRFRRFEFEVGIRRPSGVFSVNALAGRWISLRQTMITLQSPELRDEVFVGAYQEVDQIDLHPDGQFHFENLSATSSFQSEEPFNGTWQPAGTGVTLSAGGETLSLADISAGGDTALWVETEVFENGGSQNIDQSYSILIRETPTLEPSDVIGSWAFSMQRLNSYGDSDGFDQQFLGSQFEFGRIELLPDGRITGVILAASEASPSLSEVTWSIEGNQLKFEEPDEPSVRLRVSAGHDFAAGLSFEERPFFLSGKEQEYGIVTACKLPKTARLFPAPTRLRADGAVAVCAGSQVGVFYQLERSSDLLTWTAVGSPVEGTGAEICAQDPSFPSGKAFYRWRVVLSP